ncbi:phenoloxidase-activating factor 2-like [Anopheles aquasalis]|uniref:phenoloxidase-activating factor 2-like n=1 Tax=Anopheles aquasalis TaxID=42839 RepID=UPI00215A8261|nr:phenoloxidase-activating factor 2-like [Anopheles aquasalis]
MATNSRRKSGWWLLVTLYTVGVPLLVPVAIAQLDGSFWWMNGNLLKQAEALRETKDVKAVVVSKDSPFEEVRVGGNSLTDGGDAPDCICVPLGRCRTNHAKPDDVTVRDGLCGANSVCCRQNQIIPQNVSTTSTTTTTTAYDAEDRLIFDSQPPSSTTAELATVSHATPTAAPEFDAGLLLELSALLLNHSGGLPAPLEPIDGNSVEPGTIDRPAGLAAEPTVCGVRHRQALSSRVFFQDEDDDNDDAALEPVQGMANFGEFPWTVALYQLIRNGSFVYHCGAALLDARTLITAAHCVSNNRLHPNRYVVHAGDWDRRHTQERLPHQERTVSRIVVHPNYYSGALFNDLALLLLNRPFEGQPANIGPICLPAEPEAPTERLYDCLVTGWGGTPKSRTVQPIMHYTRMPLVERGTCEIALRHHAPSLGRRFQLHSSAVCAGGAGNSSSRLRADTCEGSGGSPLVCADRRHDGRYVLVGLVSWGIGCGDGVPAVLTNVAALSSWIRAQWSPVL